MLSCSFCRTFSEMLFLAFWRTSHNSSCDFGCFFIFFRSKWSQIASKIFKSRLCGGHSISSKTLWSSFLFKYLLNLFAVCLGSLSCWKVKRGPINRLPDCMAWWMKICLYFSAFIIPSILTKSQLHQLKYNPKLVSILHHVLLLDVNRVLVTLSHFFFVRTGVACFQKSPTLTYHSTATSIGKNSSCCVLTHTSIVWSYFLFSKEAFLQQLYYEDRSVREFFVS